MLDQEDELEELVMYYVCRGFPFSDDKLCQLAFELAYKTKRKEFSPTKKTAGHKWLRGYLQRKPNLRRKNSQNISAALAFGANPVQIQKFFDLLLEWVRKWKLEFLPNNIGTLMKVEGKMYRDLRKLLELKGNVFSKQYLVIKASQPLWLHT